VLRQSRRPAGLAEARCALGLPLAARSPGRAAAEHCVGGTGTQTGPVPVAFTAAVPVLKAPRWPQMRYARPSKAARTVAPLT
jgi:hypothetical protein